MKGKAVIIDYQIFESGDSTKFEEGVMELIKQGWQPLGGVSVVQQLEDGDNLTVDRRSTLYSAGFWYAQAMIKTDAETD